MVADALFCRFDKHTECLCSMRRPATSQVVCWFWFHGIVEPQSYGQQKKHATRHPGAIVLVCAINFQNGNSPVALVLYQRLSSFALE